MIKGKCPDNLKYNKKFDLICLFDVLEHIKEDKETISKLLEILKDSGRIFITVPAYQWLWSKHDENLMHQRRYSKKSLKLTFKDHNVTEEYFTYFNTFLFPFAVLDRFIKKISSKRISSTRNLNNKFPNRVINFIFKKIFVFEKFILNFFNFYFGLSILLIIKKKN